MKKFILVLSMLLMLMAVPWPVVRAAGEGEEIEPPQDQQEQSTTEQIGEAIHNTIDSLDLTKWDKMLEDITGTPTDMKNYLHSLVEGGEIFSLEEYVNLLIEQVMGMKKQLLLFLSELAAMVVLLRITENATESLLSQGNRNPASVVLSLAIIAMIGQSFYSAVQSCVETVSLLLRFYDILLPILITLLTTSGALTSAATLQPGIILALTLLRQVFSTILFPLLTLCSGVALIGAFIQEGNLDGFSSLLQSACKWVMGIVMTLLTVVLSAQTIFSSGYDGLSLKTVKYTVNSLPTIGKMFSDTVEVMMAGSVLLKNAVGTAGMLTIVVIAAQPILQMLVFSFTVKGLAAISGLLGSKRMQESLDKFASTVMIWIGAVLMCAAMLFFATVLLVGCTNSLFI